MTGSRENTPSEAEIRGRIDAFVRAFRARDLTGVLALYAPDVVSFDLVPPLRYEGIGEYRKAWEETFASFEAPIGYEVHHLNIVTGEDMALSYSLNRMSGTLKDGQRADFWLRWTACFRRIDGQWLVAHEHVSVPVDMESGQALLKLEP